jgi:hypothetical protein
MRLVVDVEANPKSTALLVLDLKAGRSNKLRC